MQTPMQTPMLTLRWPYSNPMRALLGALESYSTALEIRLTILGAEHADVAGCYSNMVGPFLDTHVS